MKKQGIALICIGAIGIILIIVFACIADYQYERDHLSYWNLAEKASTIQQKALYIDRFVETFRGKGYEGDHDAIFFKTLDNSFDKNFEALQSLKIRLDEIQKLNISSFEYQTAIQQITAQEQGEAQKMLSVFSGVWWKNHYLLLWRWVVTVLVIINLFLISIGLVKIGGGLKKIGEAMKESERRRSDGCDELI